MSNPKKVNPWGYLSNNDDPIVETNIWDEYRFSPDDNPITKGMGNFGNMILNENSLTDEDYRKQWIHFANNWSSLFVNYWDGIYDFKPGVDNFWNNVGEFFVKSFSSFDATVALGNTIYTAISGVLNSVLLAGGQGANFLIASNTITNAISGFENWIGKINAGSISWSENLSTSITNITDTLGQTGSIFLNVLGKGLDIWSSGALKPYVNGVEETTFGRLMESSWNKGNENFMKLLNNSATYKIRFSNTTPFDSGENMENIYGKMMLGAPPLFNNIADPKNRSIANTFLRDAKFLTLTPGFPKYNGSNYLLKTNDDAYHQTKTAESMLSYLLKNGLDSNFASQDRRYYTFKADYDEYYSYLETMLNTVWIKLGLSEEEPLTHNLFSFFDVVNPSTGEALSKSVLKPQYNSSLGFFVNPTAALTENISNSPTSFNIGSTANEASDEYNKLNFLTGMGTGGDLRQAGSIIARSMQLTTQMKDFAVNAASSTINLWKSDEHGAIGKALLTPLMIASDVRKFVTDQDPGAIMQSFATTNGMKVVYPELWYDSTYTKSININFEFTSPYGDPLSIFNYVLAPFLALLCFAMPRQAADNGYVSPFFVRADIPGLFTSDLALIQDFSWTKGGDNNLWTKDGLPRSISGSFLISDLYPYLAMTKRLSFLSSNPNYTVFLDNLASLHVVNQGDNNDALNEYYKTLLNRVNGEVTMTSLWNNYSENDKLSHAKYANQVTRNRLGGNNKNYTSSSWFRGLK